MEFGITVSFQMRKYSVFIAKIWEMLDWGHKYLNYNWLAFLNNVNEYYFSTLLCQ
jgi:hypothetical protein